MPLSLIGEEAVLPTLCYYMFLFRYCFARLWKDDPVVLGSEIVALNLLEDMIEKTFLVNIVDLIGVSNDQRFLAVSLPVKSYCLIENKNNPAISK